MFYLKLTIIHHLSFTLSSPRPSLDGVLYTKLLIGILHIPHLNASSTNIFKKLNSSSLLPNLLSPLSPGFSISEMDTVFYSLSSFKQQQVPPILPFYYLNPSNPFYSLQNFPNAPTHNQLLSRLLHLPPKSLSGSSLVTFKSTLHRVTFQNKYQAVLCLA